MKICNETILPLLKSQYAHDNLHEPLISKLFYALVRSAGDGDTFVDVGAADGYYALWALQAAPTLRVWAFNPSPHYQASLANQTFLNFPGAQAGKLANLCQDFRAMATKDGDLMHMRNFGSRPHSEAQAIQFSAADPSKRHKGKPILQLMDLGERCRTVTYATWADEARVGHPWMVKLDIKGGEKDVVPAMLRKNAPNLLTVSTKNRRIHESLGELVARSNYTVLYAEGPGSERESGLLQPDADGIIVAVRDSWERAGEYHGLKEYFHDLQTMGLPFHAYKDAVDSW